MTDNESTLRSVTRNLKSTKAKERQDGLNAIQEVFAQDRVVHNLSNSDGPKAWLSVFRSLYRCVAEEKEAAVKKSTSKSSNVSSTAFRRLEHAAGVVRWLTERTVHLLNKEVIKELFMHLTQTMVYRGALFIPVALDYIHTMGCLANYTPHLEHMTDDTWIKIVEMGFNVILDDPIQDRFADEEPTANDVDSDMYLGETPNVPDDDDLPAMVTLGSKKRHRRDRSPPPGTHLLKQDKLKSGQKVLAPSREQLVFAPLVSTLLSSPAAPILSPDFPNLSSGILLRLQRFLKRFPTDSSLLHSFLAILLFTLKHLSLNKKNEVQNYARSSWDGLLGLWGQKDKSMKGSLTAVLRVLFPFLIAPSNIERTSSFDCADALGRLWQLLDGEAESRWGADRLTLDALRFELLDPTDSKSHNSAERAFVAQTFRAGWDFNAGQALSWAILELQADCAGKLYQLSESVHSTFTPGTSRSHAKRTKLENPISALMHSIHAQPSSNARCYHLQTLLFFIERYWSLVHYSFKEQVINVLLQHVTSDNGVVQSWIFMNFAAIAYTEGFATARKPSPNKSDSPVLASAIWDPIWTHAIRRANVPTVCRSACHAGHTFLVSLYNQTGLSRILLSSHYVLLEIETLAKDMDVQGPAYPYDSVCMFLSQCLSIASQDVRLYRMQLEDKVLSWLIDTWKMSGTERTKVSLHGAKDIFVLLETVCGLTKRADFPVHPLLPRCQIVDTMIEEYEGKVIRDFLLYAKLPSFQQKPNAGRSTSTTDNQAASVADLQLVAPRGRERRISAFFLKSLELSMLQLEPLQDNVTAEMSCRMLDLAITAITFETLLMFNGTVSNRQVLQRAAKVISIVTPLLNENRWTVAEKSLVVSTLESFVHHVGQSHGKKNWETLSWPGTKSGIQEKILRSLTYDETSYREACSTRRIGFLRLIWQNAEVQETLTSVIIILRVVLRRMLVDPSSSDAHQTTDVDDKDGFGPIRTMPANGSSRTIQTAEDDQSVQQLLQICISFLTCGPFLQSASGEPTRDKELTEIILRCAGNQPARFGLVCPIFLNHIRHGILNLHLKHLDSFLNQMSDLLKQYQFARSERIHQLVIDLLDSTLSIWLTPQAQSSDVGEMVGELCAWLAKALRKQKISTWSLRDALAQFLDRYLSLDPSQTCWSTTIEDLPTALLPMMTADHDVRVRFRVAVLNTRLFDLEVHTGQSPTAMYTLVQQWYTVDLEKYEHMLTRMLSLGNIMIVSSAVRRGPYWHLLEACLYSTLYSSHIEAILTGVSQRLGMASLSVLFEAYSSQLAYSIRQTDADFFRFPPHLLGYSDRKQCAEATFRAFTPTNILANGRKLFENHCRVLQKSSVDGLRDCFGDIVGFQIATWMDERPDNSDELDHLVKERMAPLSDFDLILQRNVDSVVATILRALGDQDYSETGPIMEALRKCDETGEFAHAFQALSRYRKFDPLVIHKPNLPAFPTPSILRSWFWFSSMLPDAATKATTYHVLHQLFADLRNMPLVNEQNRLINAILLWMSVRHKDFDDETLLHTVTHGASLFFAQTDLARSAQSILEWAFRRYRKTRIKDLRIPNILIRLSCIAHDYASNAHDRATSSMGNQMLGWIDDQVHLLTKVTVEIGDLIHGALLAWPHQPSPQLLEAYNNITLDSLASVLSDHRITSNKFRLVRRLRDRALTKDYSEIQYSRTDFWRLKECMPSIEYLQDEDVEAFAALLTLNHGKIGSFNIEQPNMYSLRPRHRHNVTKKSLLDGTIAAREAITLTLLGMLEDDSPSHVSNAYNTLRLIMSVSTAQDLQAQMPLESYRAELDYLKLYWRSPNSRPSRNLADELKSDVYLDNFSRWISTITVLLADSLATVDPFFAQLNSILTSDLVFAEQILPVLVHTLLQAEKAKEITGLSFRSSLSTFFTSVLSAKSPDISCVRAIVDIVLHLRYFSPRTNDALDYNKWLDVDYTLLAQSAVLCGAYTTALLFLELAPEFNEQSVTQKSSTERALYEIYAHIDEPDGFYGIKSNDLQQFLVKRFHHEKQWEKAFRFHGAALEAGREHNGEEGLLKAFHYFGFDHLAIDTLQNSRGNTSRSPSASMSYRLGWRTETWDLPDRAENAVSVPLYKSLKAIYRERDSRVLDGIIRASLFAEMAHIRSLGSENLAEIREAAQDLMCLNQISQWRQDFIQNKLEMRSFDSGDWDDFINIGSGFNFSDLEALTATRISLVRSVRQREERQQIGTIVTPFVQNLIDIEKKSLLCLSRAARTSNQVQIALNSVVRAQRLTLKPSSEVSEEFANVLWLQKEEKLAVQFLQDLVDNSAKVQDADMSRKAIWLARLGTWTSEACLEKPADIWTRYFDPSISLLNEAGDDKRDLLASRATVYRECAMFSERQYHATLKSPDGIRWKVYVDRKKQEIEQRSLELAMGASDAVRKELQTELVKAQKLLQEDSELFRKHNTIRDNFLRQAIDMHSRCLEASDDFDDDSAIRFCSLWFANFDDDSALPTVMDALEHIPSHKLVFLAHQLTARLATQTSKTQDNLQRLIMRMCREHPFHSLYQVYCLRPDHLNATTTNRRQSGRHPMPTQTERGAAAGSIFDRLRADESVENRVRDLEKLCDACLEWAKFPISKDSRYKNKSRASRFKIPDNLSIRKLTQLRVPITTAHTPLDLTMQYNDCVWIDHYEPTFTTAGGLNLPKVSICHGSDGQKYKQLFKGEGNDDLRQDAVMEQVFDLVNSILQRDQETRRRDLKVREYKVIPLSPRAGVLEFVGNTFPLREWLTKGHQVYRPTDLKPNDVHSRMKALQDAYCRASDKHFSLFLEIRKKFKPVMRHYFTEVHKTPISWFSMRLNYTRSVATTSIVGHVLGIGDRHVSNILLDNVTGEIVHIDFGIAFDQGKLLTFPERVPFRMTADMVDGMGTSGTSGVFQRCAEETLRVLRQESDVIMTVLEVFKHDPLHTWTASEIKVKQAQSDVPTATTMNDTSRFNLGIGIDMSSGSADEAADRALSSVARKLDKSLSVESTVNELLAEATDQVNLGTLFHGWSAWM